MPVLPHQLPVFNVDQARIYPITVDSTAALTYGTGIAVPGIKSIQVDPDVLQKELYGDAQILDYRSKTRKFAVVLNYAELSLDVLNIITGGATVDAGTTPSQTSTFTLLNSSVPAFFKIELRVLGIDLQVATPSSLNVAFFKCRMSDNKPGLGAQEDYALQSLSCAAFPTNNNQKFLTLVENETAAALSA